ncbi:hypothetical protein LH604_27065, partial [Klebsiella pneumoniae]|nr:hypothetical protein [Klebsiella pneumoniae]
MPKYNIYTKIESNVSAVDLFYDLNVYRTDASNKKHILLSVAQQPVTSNYQTQSHETNDTEDGLSVIYIMEMNLYRKHGGKLFSVLSSPAKKMYTLGEMASGQAYSKEGANKQVISSQADSLIKISRIWADFFPANTSNQ